MTDQDGRGREGFWSIMASLGQIISAAVGVAAVVFSGFALIETQKQGDRQTEQGARVQTLAFFAQFNGDSMLEIRRKIDNENWCARWGWSPRPDDFEPGASREQLTWFIDFFDAVHACGQAELCNSELNARLFQSYARESYDDLAEFIHRRRSEDRRTDFGSGMAALANEERELEEITADMSEACRQESRSAP